MITRRFLPELPAAIPRHWLPGQPVVASILDAYSVLVPANEAFYIRTFLACKARLVDPRLRADVEAFIRQEAQHGVAHKRYWGNLDGHGYRFRAFERAIDRLVFGGVGRLAPLPLRVSMVSCVEHINAFLGHEFLGQAILRDAHPQMRALMEWHFAEEIEHKHVAFDVLTALAPGFGMRVAGFVLTVPLFYLLLGLGALSFLGQDGLLGRMATWRELQAHLGHRHGMLRRTLRHLAAYLRPGFHPSQLDDAELAASAIARHGATEPPTLVPMAPAPPARA